MSVWMSRRGCYLAVVAMEASVIRAREDNISPPRFCVHDTPFGLLSLNLDS